MQAIKIIEESKKTHEDWLAYLVYPDQEKAEEYKYLGDRFFHEKCINNYEKAIKEIKQIQAENKDLKESLKDDSERIIKIVRLEAELKAKNEALYKAIGRITVLSLTGKEKLKEALYKYGCHSDVCPERFDNGMGDGCICGFEQALKGE